MIKKMFNKKVTTISFCIIFLLITNISVAAHSGRTDSSGGHHDNKNVSGLGNYHYHCGGHPAHLHENGVCPYDPLDTIVINNQVSNMKVGETLKLECNITSVKGYTISKWQSSNPDVATINPDGTIVANKIGDTTITISTYNNSQSFQLSVVPIEIESIDLSSKDINVQVSKKYRVQATISPNNATDTTITWKSNNDDIATVDNTGIIYGKTVGQTTISVNTSNGINEVINVNVFEVLPKEIEVDTKQIKLKLKKSFSLNAKVLPEDSNYSEINYESSDPNIVTVDSEGKITAKNIGKTSIIVKSYNDKSITIPVEVYKNKAKESEDVSNISSLLIGIVIIVAFGLLAIVFKKKIIVKK